MRLQKRERGLPEPANRRYIYQNRRTGIKPGKEDRATMRRNFGAAEFAERTKFNQVKPTPCQKK